LRASLHHGEACFRFHCKPLTIQPFHKPAIANAVSASDNATWVITAEHPVAIALSTGRIKDCTRMVQFLELQTIDRNKLDKVLKRHGLVSKWERFSQRYLGE
jgi:hypothetical protein